MAKKGAKKSSKTSAKRKTSPRKTSAKTNAEDKTQKMVLENFVSLQAVMTNLSSDLKGLTEKISKLLELFEDSAKALTEKNGIAAGLGQDKEVSEKLNKIFDQNKVLAQGIALLHESNPNNQGDYPEPGMEPPMPHSPMQPRKVMNSGPPPAPPAPQDSQNQQNPQDGGRYQKSISSRY